MFQANKYTGDSGVTEFSITYKIYGQERFTSQKVFADTEKEAEMDIILNKFEVLKLSLQAYIFDQEVKTMSPDYTMTPVRTKAFEKVKQGMDWFPDKSVMIAYGKKGEIEKMQSLMKKCCTVVSRMEAELMAMLEPKKMSTATATMVELSGLLSIAK